MAEEYCFEASKLEAKISTFETQWGQHES
jgi:hypothetical protein